MKLNNEIFLVFICTSLAFLSCTNDRKEVRLDGSSTVYPLSEAVADEFMATQQDIRVTVGSSGTGAGFKKFCRSDVDITNASRGIKESEQQNCSQNKIEAIELSVALDGISIVVHPSNNWIDEITVEELKAIWEPGSSIEKWSDLDADWPDEKIQLYGPNTAHGTYDFFTETIVGESGASRSDYNAVADYNVAVQGINSDQYALGYFGLAYFEENKDKLKLLPVDGGNGAVTPTLESIKNGEYAPLSRPLFIYVNNESAKRPEVQTFIEFYLANAAEMATVVGYIPLPDEDYKQELETFRSFTEGQAAGQQEQ